MQEAAKLRSLGKYNLIASLGQGGMAKVYLALMAGPAGFNKLLVVKVLRDDVPSGSDEGVRMFWDEARLSAQLVHPNIVHTYEVGEIQGHYFLAMEFLDGQAYRTVQTRAAATQALPLTEELRILSEAARGLHYSHTLKGFNGEELGVVHRDVSPQNVFVTYDGQVKVLDFGIAKTHDAGHMTQVGVIKGKLDYIAPEQLRGDSLDGRADVFALGAMLWEAITGQRFAGGRKVAEVAKVHARITGGEPNVRTVKPDVPEALATIVDRAIALDRDARFADAAEFGDAIDVYLESIGAKPTAKSLSAIVSTLFESERTTMHKLIDQQINALKRGAVDLGEVTGELPRIGFQDNRSTSGLYVGGGVDGTDTSISTSGRGLASGMTSTGTGTHGTLATATPAGGTADLEPARSTRSRLVPAIAVSVAIAAGLAWFGTREAPKVAEQPIATTSHKTEPAQPAAMPPAQPTPVPTASPSAEAPRQEVGMVIVLNVKVTPPEAQVLLDGAPIPTPFSGEFGRSAALHIVEATADGYKPNKRLISFSKDQALEIVLERAPQVVRRSPSRNDSRDDRKDEPAPEPKVAPAEQTAPRGVTPGSDINVKSRVRRGEIDMADPYAN